MHAGSEAENNLKTSKLMATLAAQTSKMEDVSDPDVGRLKANGNTGDRRQGGRKMRRMDGGGRDGRGEDGGRKEEKVGCRLWKDKYMRVAGIGGIH